MSCETDTASRSQYISGLRALADYLEMTPAIAIPRYGTNIIVCADSTDDGGRDQVDYFAAVTRVKVTDNTPAGGHYEATLSFGHVSYTIVAIPAVVMDRYHAEMSYSGCVTPDANLDTDASAHCPYCGETDNIQELHITVSEISEARALECGDCGEAWQ
jgi:hypothetical protein